MNIQQEQKEIVDAAIKDVMDNPQLWQVDFSGGFKSLDNSINKRVGFNPSYTGTSGDTENLWINLYISFVSFGCLFKKVKLVVRGGCTHNFYYQNYELTGRQQKVIHPLMSNIIQNRHIMTAKEENNQSTSLMKQYISNNGK